MKEFAAQTIGLSLDDGKTLLQTIQQHVVTAQTWEISEPSRVCPACLGPQRLKDDRVRRLRTVFGTVRFRSPRLASCCYEPTYFMAIDFCPLTSQLPKRATSYHICYRKQNRNQL